MSKSQVESRLDFLKALEEFKATLAEIDAETVFSQKEPSWWLRLIDFKNDIRKTLLSAEKEEI